MTRFPYARLTRTRNNEKLLPLCLQVNTADYAAGGKINNDESLAAGNHTHRKRIGTGRGKANYHSIKIIS